MPFAGDLTSTANGTLALSFVAAILYAFMRDGVPSWRRTAAKTAPVLLLAILSLVEGGPWLLTAGLLASAVGDAALSREGERPFLAGLAAFLLAHLAYAGLFVAHWPAGVASFAQDAWRPAAGVALVVFSGIMLRLLRPAVPESTRLPVAVYVLAITLTGLAAFGVPSFGVAAGAALFIASDAVLATRKFLLAEGSQHETWTAHTVWALYYAAQLLITLAFLL
jgi:uncharacterized membrane protein YhhN